MADAGLMSRPNRGDAKISRMQWLALLALTGCSAVFVDGPAPMKPTCTESYAAPVVDTVIVALAVSVLVLVATSSSRGDDGDGEVARLALGVPSGVVGFSYSISALHGYKSVGACRARKRR